MLTNIWRKQLSIAAVLCLGALGVAGCGGKSNNPVAPIDPTGEQTPVNSPPTEPDNNNPEAPVPPPDLPQLDAGMIPMTNP